ncbi:hypothetical protein [Variovorax sp. PCZ-1]|uniref:hypothetical protein n=1 Tax=Variovorax sp. PCZ-1 TaxID=2835533 RepID=UPI001BCC5B4E|nr:hypothetical protein [Variovorax sp. PCZ-1]MBS7807047.1 hypothetical protein [Variovorax sp. PCZ-1]
MLYSYSLIRIFLAMGLAGMLTACGGGGGSNSDSATATSLAQYQGTWSGTCDPIINGGGTTVGSTRNSFTIPSGINSVTVSSNDSYYTTTNCTGPLAASVSVSSITLTFQGTKSVNGVDAVRIEATLPAGTPTFSGAAAFIGSCSGAIQLIVSVGSSSTCYPIPTTITTAKDIFSFLSMTSPPTFETGDDSVPADANGYPSAFLPASTGRYTRQ